MYIFIPFSFMRGHTSFGFLRHNIKQMFSPQRFRDRIPELNQKDLPMSTVDRVTRANRVLTNGDFSILSIDIGII